MNTTQQRTVYAGVALIGLGIVALLHLWWLVWLLVPVVLLGGAGYVVYNTRRSIGRYDEAVQGGMWGFGMALLWLIGAIWPGIILLAGASLLARGREAQIDTKVQQLVGQGQAALQARRSSSAPLASQRPTNITIVTPDEQSATGETTRLGH